MTPTTATASPSPSHPPIRSIALALPAYNEADGIGGLIADAAQTLDEMGLPWTVLVVDDGSTDATAECVKRAAETYKQVRLVRHECNRGLGPAILTGLRTALDGGGGADRLIVCMDADRTHPPATIPAMKEAAEAGADLVIASRFQPGSRQVGVPLLRRLMSFGARALFRWGLALPDVRDYTCGFRAFRASLIAEAFARYGEDGLITRSGFACTDELLVRLAAMGCVIQETPFVLRYDRKQGQSKMDLGLTIVETLKLVAAHRRELRNATRTDRLM